MEFLADGQERTGKDIADAVDITLALLCHHTGTLEEAGILVKRKQGQSCYHRLGLVEGVTTPQYPDPES